MQKKNNKKATNKKAKAVIRHAAVKHAAASKPKIAKKSNSKPKTKQVLRHVRKPVKASVSKNQKWENGKRISHKTFANSRKAESKQKQQVHREITAAGAKKIHERKLQAAQKVKKQQEIDEATYTENALKYIDTLVGDDNISDYLNKNVSRHASEVINLLTIPRTDEDIAASLDLKINAVRRILNIMQGYGITNYTVSKNNEGWLSFAWYINTNKVPQFFDYVKSASTDKTVLKDDCNDYFVCNSCYDENKFIFTFDAAYESNFRCNVCNKQLSRIDREKANTLISGAGDSKQQKQLPSNETANANLF